VLLRSAGEQSSALAREPYRRYQQPQLAPVNPYITQSENILGGLQNQYSPYATFANQSLQQSRQNFPQQAQNYGNINPQLNADVQTAMQRFPQNVQQYMDPYRQHVVNQIATLGNRNFQENMLPALSGQFESLGQFGSSRHAQLAQRAARDMQEAILNQQHQALSEGYGTAGNLFNADQGRALEAARLRQQGLSQNYETGGNLFNADQLRALQTARATADIGQQHQGATIGAAAGIGHAGEAQRERSQEALNIPYQEFLREQEYPSQRLGEHTSRLHGQPYSTQSSSFNVSAPPPGPPRTNTIGRLGELAGSLYGARRTGMFKEGGSVLSSLVSHKKSKKPKTKSYFGVEGLKFNTNSPKVGKHPSRHGRI
jgi:hypothetical protein